VKSNYSNAICMGLARWKISAADSVSHSAKSISKLTSRSVLTRNKIRERDATKTQTHKKI